jgi:hypothetical protein
MDCGKTLSEVQAQLHGPYEVQGSIEVVPLDWVLQVGSLHKDLYSRSLDSIFTSTITAVIAPSYILNMAITLEYCPSGASPVLVVAGSDCLFSLATGCRVSGSGWLSCAPKLDIGVWWPRKKPAHASIGLKTNPRIAVTMVCSGLGSGRLRTFQESGDKQQ